MPDYEIRFVDSAAKEFRSLPVDMKNRIQTAVDGLVRSPRPTGVKKLRGSQGLYRIRVGEYRVVYEIDDKARLLRVTRVRHRKEAYR